MSDPQFKREMSVLLGPAILPGNKIQVLHNGSEIFPAMLAAIRSAQRTITFETYIYWSGEIGREFSQALSERARSGVKVRVTIDWGGSLKMDAALVEDMTKAGVEVHRYRPLTWYNLHRVNNRTHRKLLVIDGRIGFTGGVGVADQWMGDAQDPEHWRDSHYRIEGPVVAQVQAAFNDNWIKTTGRVLNGAEYYPELAPAGDSDAQLFVASPAGGSESMHLMYLIAIAAARSSIDLAAAYFVPDALITRSLLEARAWRTHPRAAAGQAYRCDLGAAGLQGQLGAAAAGRHRHPRIPAHHAAHQAADHRRPAGLGGLDQLRHPLVPPQRRGQPERLRP